MSFALAATLFRTRSTHKGDIRVEICSSCHPFFTGKQKLMEPFSRFDPLPPVWHEIRAGIHSKAHQTVSLKKGIQRFVVFAADQYTISIQPRTALS